MSTQAEKDFEQVQWDIAFLRLHGALGGVAEIIRERRRQVEKLGYTPEHDEAEHNDGDLPKYAEDRLEALKHDRFEGTADIGSDEYNLRQAGALVAAEIDRLQRMLSGG